MTPKETIKGVDMRYAETKHKDIMSSNDDMEVRKHRFKLEAKQVEDYQIIMKAKNRRLQRSKWIRQAHNREREILGIEVIDREGL